MTPKEDALACAMVAADAYDQLLHPLGKLIREIANAPDSMGQALNMLADLRAVAPFFAWQPIETAPKDGAILGWTKDERWLIVWWDGQTYTEGRWTDGQPETPQPTQWMHLPEPPNG